MTQTWTNINPNLSKWKEALKQNMIGKKLSDLRTPSLVIDRTRLERNCQQLGKITTELKIKVRVHVKTHKTLEATRIQLEGAKSDAIVVSTMAEADFMINSDLVKSQLLKEVLLGFPITPDKFAEVFELSKKVPSFQIFIDSIRTFELLESYVASNNETAKVNVYMKVDCGYGRAGAPLDQDETVDLAKRLHDSSSVHFLGIYAHAGHSYASENAESAFEYFQNECNAARAFRDLFAQHGIHIQSISIGATPTVKALLRFMNDKNVAKILDGITEVHAGAYAFLDRQQVSTGLGTFDDVVLSVACRVSSIYPSRGSILIDGGALAFSKDTAPQGGFGQLFTDLDRQEPVATLTKIAQEHGVVANLDDNALSRFEIGKVVYVLPNHCCLTAACHAFYLIIEEGKDTVVDVWVPVKGW
ncbi:hypothetical protein G6F43_006063 [Rhizopus delemar]|nr:hypothetical protein G6F43_006063 [Rhizopus delemar]